MEDSEKILNLNIPEQYLVTLHFALGLAIRNGFGLHQPDNDLVNEYGTADDAASLNIQQLW